MFQTKPDHQNPESGSGLPLRVACVQMRSGLDRMANVHHAAALIRQAASEGAKLIATPEMTNVVDQKPDRLLADLPVESDLPERIAFADLAEELGIWLLIGSMALRSPKDGEDGRPRALNRSYLFSPTGEITHTYDKIHMFDVSLPDGETWRESALYTPGTDAVMATTPLAKLGLSICYDVRFPGLYRQLAQHGAQILCIPAAFTRQTGKAHWKTLLTARAIECGAFVIAPAQGGKHEDDRETWGHSTIIGPWGNVLAEAMDDNPGIILADLDLSAVNEMRQRIPNLDLEQPFAVRT